MARLTEDLLVLARVESGERNFSYEIASPHELLNDVQQTFGEICESRGMELSLINTASTPVFIDRDAMHQVFANLVENALKYGASGKKIIVGACETEEGVQFFVRDFGEGIPSEHLPRLFERFYRVDKARSREASGTGLGLAIVKHVVRAHGGSIKAESELITAPPSISPSTTEVAAERRLASPKKLTAVHGEDSAAEIHWLLALQATYPSDRTTRARLRLAFLCGLRGERF